MNKYAIVVSCMLIGKFLYAQSPVNRDADLIANGLKVNFHPTDFLANLTIATRNAQHEKGLFFFFVGKEEIPWPRIRMDSLILNSYNNEFLTLHHPDYDSIIFNGRNLTWQVMHSLSLQEAEFLKEKEIISIILIVNKIPVPIQISKNSRRRLKKLAITSW